MKKILQMLLAACRALWLGGLKLLGWPWRWLVLLLGLGPPAAGPQRSEKSGPGNPPHAPSGPEPAAPQPPPAAAGRPRDEVIEDLEPAEPVPRDEMAADVAAAERPEPLAPRTRAARAGQFTEGVFRNDAGQRDYKLYVPDGKPPGLVPLVVMLHGCKQDPDDFAAGTRMNQLADRQTLIVLYPAQTRSANPYACWNWFNRRDQQRDAGEPSMIAGMINEVVARHPVDPRRVYVAGLSAGGAMTMILAHTYPELLAAAGIHSGLPYAAAQDMITALGVMKRGAANRVAPARAKAPAKGAGAKTGVPLIVFHGDHDKTVHPLNGEHVVEQALALAHAAKPHDLGHPAVHAGRVAGGHAYTRTVHTDRAGHVQVEHWRVQGAGHAWSGGDAKGSFTDPLGPDASAEMLRFFLERSAA